MDKKNKCPGKWNKNKTLCFVNCKSQFSCWKWTAIRDDEDMSWDNIKQAKRSRAVSEEILSKL